MGFVLIAIGSLLVVAGARDQQNKLFSLLVGDFTGQNSFLWWIAAIGVVGGAGYVPTLRGLSNAFLALIFIVFILSNRGVFQNFTAAIQGVAANAPPLDTKQSDSGSQTLQPLAPLKGLGGG